MKAIIFVLMLIVMMVAIGLVSDFFNQRKGILRSKKTRGNK